MTELLQAASQMTWPGAVAFLGFCGLIVGVAWAFAWMMRG